MNCLSPEQLVALVLGNPQAKQVEKLAAERDHVRHCRACAGALARVAEGMSGVAAAHAWFERGHEQARARLLAALDSEGAEHRVRPWRNGFRALTEVATMRRMLIGSSAGAALIGLLLVWAATRPPSALAQTAKALREVKSYQCRLSYVEDGAGADKEREVEILRWAAPGSYRMESHEGGKPVSVRILIRGKPGLDIDHQSEVYQRLEPLHQPESPLLLLGELARFTGQADRELPERRINGKAARGFEIALDKIDPDFGDGTLRMWPDPETKLPLRLEVSMLDLGGKMILEDFAWDVPTDRWFDTEPPAKYQDRTPTPASAEEQTELIVKGLKAYAKYCGGKYPPVQVVYGDVTSARLFKAAGLSSPQKGPTEEETTRDEYRECSEAAHGYGWMNTIQRHNADAAYHGKAVGPDAKGKVLFRWKLPDGEYRVIYGDLRAETIPAARLKELEER